MQRLGSDSKNEVDIGKIGAGAAYCLSVAWRTLLCCLALAACVNSQPAPQPPAEPSPLTPPRTVDAEPTLVASYFVRKFGVPQYMGLRYQPRQFATELYRGWDKLDLSGLDGIYRKASEREWLRLELSRPATLKVLWPNSNTPRWLASWKEDEAGLGDLRIFTRSFAAGSVELGGLNDPGDETLRSMYTVLFAEADGRPSAAPAVPAGLETPRANQTCPTWVHDQYVTPGPDGRLYQGWHPQIDPVYWCYFGHDHGADPKLMPSGKDIAFEYVAYYNKRQNEAHNGFKGYKFDDIHGNAWYIVVHGGTDSHHRFAAQFHTVYVRAESPSGGELVSLGYKADFGPTRSNRRVLAGVPQRVITPTLEGFPDQAAIDAKSQGAKNVRVVYPTGAGFEGFKGYETWVAAPGLSARALGLDGLMTFDFFNPQTACLTIVCNNLYYPDDTSASKGERRAVVLFRNFRIEADKALATGEFYTDPYGNELRPGPNTTDAVRQYVKPDLRLYPFPDADGSGVTIITQDAWNGNRSIAARGPTKDHPPAPILDLEGGLQDQN